MAKKVTKIIKLQIAAAKATPAPPIGTALGPAGVNIGDFVKKFNDASQSMVGSTIPVIINVYDDRSFDFIMKKPPAAEMVKKAIGLTTGSGTPNSKKVGKITKAQIEEIAKNKMEDMNAVDLAGAMKMIEGTCRSLGVEVVG
jgi:large subunit ribosomal protein L11